MESLLISARCQDGENIQFETEWNAPAEKVIGVFVVLGMKIANDIAGTEGTLEVYKEFERMFRKLQDKETEADLRGMIEEEQKCI